MIIEVTYQLKDDTTDPHSHFKQTEYFECDTFPDKATIAKKLSTMTKDFAEDSISITEHKDDTVSRMRRSGLRVTKL